jgi:hypothetical protein
LSQYRKLISSVKRYINFFVIEYRYVSCFNKFSSADEQVGGDVGYYMDVLHWLSDIMVKEAYVACWCSCSIWKLKIIGQVLSGRDVDLFGFVSLCANVRCSATVGYGRWYGAIKDALPDFFI